MVSVYVGIVVLAVGFVQRPSPSLFAILLMALAIIAGGVYLAAPRTAAGLDIASSSDTAISSPPLMREVDRVLLAQMRPQCRSLCKSGITPRTLPSLRLLVPELGVLELGRWIDRQIPAGRWIVAGSRRTAIC